MNVRSVSVTERGRRLASRLPYPSHHGRLADTVRADWHDVDGWVLFVAVGAAVRVAAPLLAGKDRDPAVVCVDEAGRFAVAVVGGHGAGANDLAREVADRLGALPVVTTATDATSRIALDQLEGFTARGDVAGVTRALLDGRAPVIDDTLGWPLPPGLVGGTGPERVLVTDQAAEVAPGTVVLHPPSLVVGVGSSTDAPPADLEGLVTEALGSSGLARESVGEVATIDRRATEPAVVGLGRPVRVWSAVDLALVQVPNPSDVVRAAVGTPSVAEAAALAAAGPGGTLVVPKQASATATVAVARRARPRGSLAIVGLGPGGGACRTPAATAAVREAEVVIGYGPYVDQCAELVAPDAEVVRSPIGAEEDRARQALAEAEGGRRVALVCSGDAGTFAMAAVTLGLLPPAGDPRPPTERGDPDIEVIPGVPAATAAAALLGAPLGHDHAVISLSDLRTPWVTIESRLQAAAETDLVVALYNPRSRGRSWQLDAARSILLQHRAPATPVGVVRDAWRTGQHVELTTLGDLACDTVGMTTCVIVGSTATRGVAGRMVTPR